MVNLSIDGGSPMTMDNFGKHYTLNSEAPLYVGGEDLPYIPLQASPLSCGDSVPRQGLPVLYGQRLTRRAGARVREMPKDEVVLLNDYFGRFCCLGWGLAAFWPIQINQEGCSTGLGWGGSVFAAVFHTTGTLLGSGPEGISYVLFHF